MSMRGLRHSKETKEKIRLALSGANSKIRGIPQTEEHKRKRSLSQAKYPGNNRWDRYLKAEYGISEIEYDAMVLQQNGLCAICGQPETVTHKGKLKRLSIDHNHSTEKVRGLLCDRCNHGIGLFKESAARLLSAIKYLERYK